MRAGNIILLILFYFIVSLGQLLRVKRSVLWFNSCLVTAIAWVCFLQGCFICCLSSGCGFQLFSCWDTPRWSRLLVVLALVWKRYLLPSFDCHALTVLSSCRSHRTGIASSSWGCAVMQRGQNILAWQSIQMVHPAKSHSLRVCPNI